jgi:hypothetical protein
MQDQEDRWDYTVQDQDDRNIQDYEDRRDYTVLYRTKRRDGITKDHVARQD